MRTWKSITSAEDSGGYEAALKEYKLANKGNIFDTTSIVLYLTHFIDSTKTGERTRCLCMRNPFLTLSGLPRRSEVSNDGNIPLLLLSHNDKKCTEAAEKLKKFLAFCCSSGSEASSPNPCHSYQDVKPAFLWVGIKTQLF
jgi:hypothetical protein